MTHTTYQLNNLIIGYPGHTVAGPMTVSLSEGEMCCLLGANGTGKSTLLRTLAAFQPALSGELLLNGTPLSQIPPRRQSTLVGIVLTDRIRTAGITVRDMVGMGRNPYTNFWGRLTDEDYRLVDEAMQEVGITEFAHRQIANLSDGERQKVMIAKALAQGTPTILLDEPTAFLDFPSKVEIMLLLSQLAHEKKKSILISTHDLDLALQTADSLWLMGKRDRTAKEHTESKEEKEEPINFCVGTPRELAANGILPKFFPGKHLQFDAEALRFHIRL